MRQSISDKSFFSSIQSQTEYVKAESGLSYFEASEYRNADSAIYFVAKRIIDLLAIGLAGIWLLPLFLIITVLIKLDSPGPAFFIHERVGVRRTKSGGKVVWGIRKFPMFKFRSMLHNADQSLHQQHVKAYVLGDLTESEGDGATFKLTNDPRITRFGRFLRKTSLDELPQLINVLRGEMSLVGPRPVPEYEVAYYDDQHYERLTVLSGMTGLWQIEGRGDVSFTEMIDLDIRYVQNCSIWLDIKILLLTIPATMAGRGAE